MTPTPEHMDEMNRMTAELESLIQQERSLESKLTADASLLSHIKGRIFKLRWQIDRFERTGEAPIDPRHQLGFDDDAIHDDDFIDQRPFGWEMH